jgi:hypothetical protein
MTYRINPRPQKINIPRITDPHKFFVFQAKAKTGMAESKSRG